MATVEKIQRIGREALGVGSKGELPVGGRLGFRAWFFSRRMWGDLFLMLIMAATMALRPGRAVAEDLPEITLVTHRGIGIESVASEELSRLFLDLTNDLGGVRLKAVNLSDRDLKIAFLERITGMSERQIEQHFVQAELRGEGKWPPEVEDAEELVRLIVKSRNVIGWIPVSELENLKGNYRNAVRVIAVDGLKPGDKGYLLGASR